MEDLQEKLISLCKRRGFVYQGSEIYGGMANSYDYGPLGSQLKNNIKQLWWKMFVTSRADMVGMDAAIIMNPKVWEASGHTKNFSDPLVECKQCHKRFREDHLKEVQGEQIACPDCKGECTQTKHFNLMFKTNVGPIEGDGSVAYLRPETAAGMFVNYKNVLETSRKRVPFGMGQIGKAFRNEITTGNFIFRLREFEQMEVEYFVHEDDWERVFDEWLEVMKQFMKAIGLKDEDLYFNNIASDELAHYSKRTIDVEFKYPFGQKELYGLAYRTDYDLKKHMEHSGQDLTYTDQATGEKFVPHVVEPSMGLDRTILAVLLSAYDEEQVENGKEETETRVVMRFPKEIAPVQIAVLPLSKKEELCEPAKKLAEKLRKQFLVEFDETQSIGKRYRRQDEIGTPYCVTFDFDSLEDNAVTVRDRDSMKQERIALEELPIYLNKKIYE